jgi:general secretion pathway protein G
MRFNKRSRKIRIKKKNKTSRSSASFWGYAAVAVILLGAFYFLLYGSHTKGLRRVRQEKIQEDFDRICAAAIVYSQDHGAFPSTEQGIAALVRQAGGSVGTDDAPAGTGILERVPLDPWQNPYVYKGAASADAITLICWGKDGKQGGTGEAADVVRQGCRSATLPLR